MSADVEELAEKLDSFSLRRILKAKWGKKFKYKGIKEPQTAVEHISEGHFFSSRPGEDSSRFSAANSNVGKVKELVNNAVANGEHVFEGGQYKIRHEFKDVIGTGSSGRKTEKILVYIDCDGNITNAYPVD